MGMSVNKQIILQSILFAFTSIFIVILLINGYIYLNQDNLIFKSEKLNPDIKYNIGDNYENVSLQNNEGYTTNCWYIKTPNKENNAVLLYFLGNGGYVEKYIELFDNIISNVGIDIFSCSNRGSGLNAGILTEEHLYADAMLAFDYVKKKNPPHIFIFGSSMGGAMAIETALKTQKYLSGLIVENTFLSLKHISKYTYPFLYFFIFNFNMLISSRMDNMSKIDKIQVPVLFNISINDTVIPSFHTQTLYELCTSKVKAIFRTETGTHSNIIEGDDGSYYKAMKSFIEQCIHVKNIKGISL